MKIALLHYSAPPVVGGVESVIGQHARLMAEAGHQVHILAARGQQMDARINFIQLPLVDSRHPRILEMKKFLDMGVVPADFNTVCDDLLEGLRANLDSFDYLIAHNVCSLNKNLALTAALHHYSQQSDAPHLILWHHDLAWTTARYLCELHDGYPWDLLRTAWPGVKQVVVSQARQLELAALMNIPVEQIVVVSNGIDLEAFYKFEGKSRRFVRELRLLESAPIFLLPVRITPRKNIELALRILAEMRKTYPQATLVVTGPLGPHNPANVQYFERLCELRCQLGLEGAAHFLAERLEQTGQVTPEYLPDEVIADFYRLADVLILPSHEEGFGIPLLEAGLAGLPVFCSDIAPLRALGNEHAHYFSPDADPVEVARQIEHFLGASSVYALRVRVRQGYTWKQIYHRDIAPLLSGGNQP